MNDSDLSMGDILNTSGQPTRRNIKKNLNDSDLSVSDGLNFSGHSSIKNRKDYQNDSDTSMGDILNTSHQLSIRGIKEDQNNIDLSVSDALNVSGNPSLKNLKGHHNDSDLNIGDILNTSHQSSIRSFKGNPNNLDTSVLNLSGQSNKLSTRKQTNEDSNDSSLSRSFIMGFHSQSSISAKGFLNDTQETAGILISNLQGVNNSSILEQDFVPDTRWLRESKEIAKKLEENLYEVQQNKNKILDNQDIYLHTDQFIKPDHEVRAYQDEIFQNSVDKDSIFMIETDSGKLSIVMMHILHRLKNFRDKKVVFLCPQIDSVKQQAILIKAIISRLYSQEEYSSLLMELQPKVLTLHGGKGDDGWKLLKEVKNSIVIATTPQYLLNGFRRRYIGLEEFSLMVFDECHLCLKSHPYNMIMQEFYYCLKNTQEKPQILGVISSGAPMTFGFKKEESRVKLTEVCQNLNAKFCTLSDRKIKTFDSKLDAWTFANDAELDALDILGLADQRKLTAKFDKIGFLELWNHSLDKIFNTIKWDKMKTKMLTEDYFRSKILNKAIALSLELGYYAVYLYFAEICERFLKRYEGSNEILSGFLKSIEGYNDKIKISGKCKLLMENLAKLVQPDRKGIVFVEKKYMGRILNKIINNNSDLGGVKHNIIISTNIKQKEMEALDANFAISFHEPKTTLSILQIRNSISTYNILLSKNTAENRLKNYEFGLFLQNTHLFAIEKYHPKDSPIETSQIEYYQGLNTNWADWLSKIYCKSLPPNSIDINKSFYLMLQQLSYGKPQFTCIMLLPSQCNVRIVLGGTYPIKNDAKRSAALKCCEELISLNHFDEHLNPKSLNKSLGEFANLQTEPFECQEDFEDLENISASENLHHISHFAKPFELEEDGKFYKGFLYEIIILEPNSESDDESDDETRFKIGFVHSSKFLDKVEPADTKIRFQKTRKEIKFTLKQYQDYLLIYRYLAAIIKSKSGPILQFLNILTQDSPNFYEFQEKQLDPDYEIWISQAPCLSFFVIMNDDCKVAEDFVTEMKHYIEYQCQVYQYINSISLEATEYEPLWDLPRRKGEFPENLEKYVIQDIWKFDKHVFKELKDLQEIDYHEVKDRRSKSLQMREILLVDPFLRNFEDDRDDENGFEVESMDKKKPERMIYFEDELMISPLTVELHKNLKDLFERFKKIKQDELSWRLYEKVLKGYEKGQTPKEKEYSINTGNIFDVFEFFGEQFLSYLSFYQPYRGPEKRILNQSSSSIIQIDFDDGADLGLKEKLKEMFVIERYNVEKDNYTLLGEKLIEMLMHIDIFLDNRDDWDYSLEKIKRERIQNFKKKSKFFEEIKEFFISANGNILLSNPIITRDDLEPYRFSAEYVAKANFGKIVKNTAFYLFDKNQKDLKQTVKFLFKIGLLENENTRIKKEPSDGKSLNILEGFYMRLKGLETVIDYKFTNKRLLLQAFMEISLRDNYVEWTEKIAPLLKKFSLFGLKEKVFQNNGEECPIELPPLNIEDIFPYHVPGAINHYHSNVNEMDRLRWLGEGLVQYYITEWVYESAEDEDFCKKYLRRMDIDIEMMARYLTEERFITAVSWKYNLEDCLIAHNNCFSQLKFLKENMPPKELFIKNLDEQTRRLCYVSASVFYSLIGAIFLDSQGDLMKVREVILELITPVAKKHFKREFILEYARNKLEKYCESKRLEKPVIKKLAVEEKESFTMPASSKYVLYIGDEEYNLNSTSLKTVEYALYVLACEKLGL